MGSDTHGVHVLKMHGTHNTFAVVDERIERIGDHATLAQSLCEDLDVDGLLAIGGPPAEGRDFATMRIFNADGGEAEMCGNGMRCVAQYLREHGAPDRFTVATKAGPIGVEILERRPEYRVRVDVGTPQIQDGGREAAIDAAGRSWTYRSVSLGNPHIVIIVDDIASVDVERAGAALATDSRFPNGTNVHFVQPIDRHAIGVRHYERGVGITQSCGTGAVASAVAAIVAKLAESPVTVHVPGGALTVDWQPGGSAFLTGPSEIISEPSTFI